MRDKGNQGDSKKLYPNLKEDLELLEVKVGLRLKIQTVKSVKGDQFIMMTPHTRQ